MTFRTRLRSPASLLAMVLGALPCAAARSELQVEPAALDFGERGQNERPEAPVQLRNTGTAPILIQDLKKSCDCIALSPPTLPSRIEPGQAVTVLVSMGSGRAMGRLDKSITIRASGAGRPEVSIPVRMRVFEDLEVEPRSIRFEGVLGGKPEKAVVDVKRRRGGRSAPLELKVKEVLSGVKSSSGEYLRATQTALPDGQRIVVELDPRHPEGRISAELVALLDQKSLIIPITGEMFAWIKVSPGYLNFSGAREDAPESTRRELLLTSTDGTPFRVLGMESRNQGREKEPVKLELAAEPLDGKHQPLPTGAASTTQKVLCRVRRGEGFGVAFFGRITVRTDHPRKPEVSFSYGGFFAVPGKKR